MTNTSRYIPRNRYLNALSAFMDKPVIKVLKGMRRVGKSVLMQLYMDKLRESGIAQSNILYINKESLEFEFIKTYTDLYRYAKNYFNGATGKNYIFIDEVQEIAEWEKAITSFLSENIADIVISGSNARLFSSELATLLSGRYVEIVVHPLTFSEFLLFRKGSTDVETEFKNYLRYGGLPGLHQLSLEDEIIFNYLNSILNTILYRDIITRHKIRDASIFDRIVRYIFDNIGNITSAKKIADHFKSQRIKVSVDTILNYISYIEQGLLIERVPRYDIKGKKYLEFTDKYFLNDIGLRHGFIGYGEKDINAILENIVFKEMEARGYKLSIGVMGQNEVDFIAEKQGRKKYIQVCYNLGSEETVQREFGNLKRIDDNYEKLVISMDKFFPEESDGIIHKYLIDFLLEEPD